MDSSKPQIQKLWEMLQTGAAVAVDDIVNLLKISRPGVSRYINWIKQRHKVEIEAVSVIVDSSVPLPCGNGTRKSRQVSHYRLKEASRRKRSTVLHVPKQMAQEEPEEKAEPVAVPHRNGEFEILDPDNAFTKVGEAEMCDVQSSLEILNDHERFGWE